MKGILKNLHRYVLWADLSAVFWAWIISLITDPPGSKKVILYADLDAINRDALAAVLAEDLPKHIKFV